MVRAGTAVVATLAVGGTALGIYAYGLHAGWWTLPTWLGGPSAAQKQAAQRAAFQAAMRRAEQAEADQTSEFGIRSGSGPAYAPGSAGYIGHPIASTPGGSTSAAVRAGARYAESGLIPYRNIAPVAQTPAGITSAANQNVLRRLFAGSTGQ